jgi:hypothetical protein
MTTAKLINLVAKIPEHKQKFRVVALEADGKCSYFDHAVKLKRKNKGSDHFSKATKILERVAEHEDGPLRYKNKPKTCHQIEGEIWQLRFGDLRILWFWGDGEMIVCSHFFIKDTDATPPTQIKSARNCFIKYKENYD